MAAESWDKWLGLIPPGGEGASHRQHKIGEMI